ncbi:threonine/homoserine exporter RhtA [Yersinia ruckeri]|uniref:threonine/homoserine exporter RhtA n=1 Tax=Yersinia ruckeri TaxID=29486 RepID=UPI0004E29954|nr:threonine/homoserine exporter RhtA [Yersinia ruckeri]AJI95905.1 inner membrane transporter rhtA [Yersinia ruckeri]AKA39730.1 threonine transporter [Yersinia ruckeri]ARZ01575.1 threonine and homoserine efflux system [Yersinia ruckeri]AUQ43552.1 threonine/homoserine exporter RhtA [Yersinia ruckeri]EKN4183400.1 threonine/homoserine exporter RhtA [Yersinia ruckeri]
MSLSPPSKSSFPLLPICLLVIAMVSIQSGASLAKSLFPLVGAQGITSLRLGIGTLILFVIFKPWKMRFAAGSRLALLIYGLALGGMNFLFYLSLKTVPLGIAVALEFTGPLAVAMFSSRRPIDFLWVGLAILGLTFLLPLGQSVERIDLFGAACALGAGACWAIYILSGQKAGGDHGAGTVAIGSLIAALVFCPIGVAYNGMALFSPAILPVALAVAILSTALPYSLEMVALTRLPARTFGTLMSLEPALAAISGLIFLNEHLSLVQWLALASIICASIGATLTIRAKPKIEELA